MKLLALLIALSLCSGCTKKQEPVEPAPPCSGEYTFFTVDSTDDGLFNDYIDHLQFAGAAVLERYSVYTLSRTPIDYGMPNRAALIRNKNPEIFKKMATGQIPSEGLSRFSLFCGSIPEISTLKGEAFSFLLSKVKGDPAAADKDFADAIHDLGLTKKYTMSREFVMTVHGATGGFKDFSRIDAFAYQDGSKRALMDNDPAVVGRLKAHNEKYATEAIALQLWPLPPYLRPPSGPATPILSGMSDEQYVFEYAQANAGASDCAGNLFFAKAYAQRILLKSLKQEDDKPEFKKIGWIRDALKQAAENLSSAIPILDRIMANLSDEQKRNFGPNLQEFKARSLDLKAQIEKEMKLIDERQVPTVDEIQKLLSLAIQNAGDSGSAARDR